ncbi:tyrosine-type recombinase/integrase [Salinibacterium soli]|uniref:Tyrosine-type recombinase/integrase n=1 Tax=Antiquaquibacter soli TaxID=3064523 RepID=A0ABT9BL84_9MICO|nr:tyrosine-type recombinase/integrase [Protaetiibacter sp. WY-16]MDO7881775.1 tyrosine-type recombinase/integrase [Protaetiibacter sp. WY-16]
MPITRDEAVVGYTCPECPTAVEPIRRVETKPGRVVYRARVDSARPTPGRPRQQGSASFPTLDGARSWVAEVRSAVAASGLYGAAARAASETVGHLCERWIETRVDVRRVTREGYRNWLAPVFRHDLALTPVTELGVAEVQSFVAWLAREGMRPRKGREIGTPLSASSMRSVKIALQQALDLAVAEGTIQRNVVKLARWPKARTVRGQDLRHWQPVELVQFRDHADADRLAGAWRLTLSGMTRADIMGLRWGDVDLDGGIASVSVGRVALDDGSTEENDPKSAQRVRSVPFEAIHPGTVALLKRMKAQQAADRLAAGAAWRDCGLVVVDELGDPLAPQVYSDRFRRLCALAGVPVIKLHNVRHSIAFWLHQLEVAPADAAALLGHSVEVHLTTYLPHSGSAGIRAAARALGEGMQKAVASGV